jgi:hypothetical protein
MTALDKVFSGDVGLASHGLAGGDLVPSSFSETIENVWILSKNTPQLKTDRGKWIDTSDWSDANVWYD